MPRQPETQEVHLDELNQTELVALCNWVGIKASRGWTRTCLIQALETFTAPVVNDPIAERALGMSSWLKKWWERTRMQAKKRVCPECSNCRDLQILECFYANKGNIEGRR